MNLQKALKRYNNLRPVYDVYRAYSRGEQQLKFVDGNFKTENGLEMQSIRENLCGATISAFTDKIVVTDWGSDNNNRIAEELHLDSVLNTVFSEAFRCGTGYLVTVKSPTQEVIVLPQRADQIQIIPDDLDPYEAKAAVRFWVDNDHYPCMMVFTDTTATKYRANNPLPVDENEGLVESNFPTSLESWTREKEEIHGFDRVPVCQWKHGSESGWDAGQSILADVIPIQDALNHSLANTLVLSDSYARPFWYLLNYKPSTPNNPLLAANQLRAALTGAQWANGPEDVAGGDDSTRRFNRKAQKIFTTDGSGPFGQLEPPDISKLLDVQDRYALKIARVVGIPSYYLTQTSGDVPSGASLRVLSSRLSARVGNFNNTARPQLIRLGELAGMKDPKPTFASPMPMDETEQIDIADKKANRLGYALEDAISGLGESDAGGIVARARDREETSVYPL